MSAETVFKCNICRDRKSLSELIGVIFSTNTKFRLGDPKATDGCHICDSCLTQIYEQMEDQAERLQLSEDKTG